MKGNAFTVACVAIVFTACGRAELAAQPVMATQAVRTTTPVSFDFPLTITSPCTGELLRGTVTLTAEETVVIDAKGGSHLRSDVVVSSTYVGDAGTTFTESGRGRVHINMPSSGAINAVQVFNGTVTGSDGTTFLAKERFIFIVDANGIVRVVRNNAETNALRCQRG